MKVIVNGRYLGQKASGVQNYANGIVKSLIKTGLSLEVVMPPIKNKQFEFAVKPIGSFNGFIWEQYFLPRYIRKQQGVFLLNLCNSAPMALKNKAVTIHDLAFEEDKGKWFNWLFRQWYKFLIPRICKSSKAIFTVSEFSKRELIRHYNLPPERITVASPGLSDITFDTNAIPQGDYVMVTGANNPRKNALWVIENINILKKEGLKLVLLGNRAKAFNNIPINTTDNIVFFENLSSSAYFSLIKKAKALICPSLYEGFGIPILESLSLGTPVIVSNIPVFREIFGNIPVYFELNDRDSYTKAIKSVKEKVISQSEMDMLKDKYNYDKSAKLILKQMEALT